MTHSEFIEAIGNAARSYYDQYQILPSLTIAQAICESNWGKSTLSAKYFNFFGMKWNSKCGCEYVTLPTMEWTGSEYITIDAKFRKYPDIASGIKGYYEFLQMKRYQNLRGVKDSEEACRLIAADGWASSPTYAKTLMKIIEDNHLRAWDLTSNEDNLQKPEDNIYIVKPGDTLWRIALQHLGNGSNWRIIFDYNDLTSTTIYPGQKLKLPGKGV